MVRKPLSDFGHAGGIYGKIHAAQVRICVQPSRERIAGKFIGQNHGERRVFDQRGTPSRTQPRATATGAKVDDSLGAAIIDGAENLRLNGPIDICPAGDRLEIVGGSMAHGLRTPRLVEDFKKLKTPQTSIADLSTKPSPRADPPRWR